MSETSEIKPYMIEKLSDLTEENLQSWLSEENLATKNHREFAGFEIIDTIDGGKDETREVSLVTIKAVGEYPQHIHKGSDAYFIITKGSAVFLSGKERRPISPGDRVEIPRGMAHGFELSGKEVFRNNISDELLKTEIENIFNHPLKEIVLLSVYDRDTFNTILNKYCKTFTQKAEIRLMLDILFSRGLKALRDEILAKASERTWFRKQKKLEAIAKLIQLPRGITQLDNAAVLEYILSQFGIASELRVPQQQTLFR